MNKQGIERAITILQGHICGDCQGYGVACQICEIKKAKDTAISALQQQLDSGWILVLERLPEKSRNHNTYVTLRYKETGHVFSSKGSWKYGKFFWFNGKEISDKYEVIAWKYEYMPKPFKQEVSE